MALYLKKPRRLLALLLAVACLTTSASAVGAAPPLILTDGQSEYPLGMYLDVLEDGKPSWSIDDVSSTPVSERFTASEQESPYFGPVPVGYVWVKFTVRNDSADPTWIVEALPAVNYEIDLYTSQTRNDGSRFWQIEKTGGQVPFVDWPVKHRHFPLRLAIQPGESRTFYMHIGANVVFLNMTLRSEESFAKHDHDEQIVLGLFYGLTAVMVLYNLFLFFALRETTYLYYVLMIGFGGLWFAQFNGMAPEYLWPRTTWGWYRVHILVAPLYLFWGLRFVQTFLLTRTYAPRIHKVISVLMGTNLVFALLAVADMHTGIIPFFDSVYQWSIWICVFSAGIVTWRRGFRPARYFLIAWGAYVGGALSILAVAVGVFPFNFVTWHSFQFGQALEAVLLSLALANRINILRHEKELEEAAAREAELRARGAELEARAMEEELRTAHNLQMGLMPREQPNVPGIDVAGLCVPAEHVGGDFYQYYNLPDGRFAVSMADVTGHSMEAAIPMVLFSGVLSSQMTSGVSIEELFPHLNDTMHETLDTYTFVCFTMAEFDPTTRRLRLSNGGCPSPYHYRAASRDMVELEMGAYPLGVRKQTEYGVLETQLEVGDYLVFYSDGITEAEKRPGNQFGPERTANIIQGGCEEGLSATAVLERVIEEVRAFTGANTEADDQTIVVLKVES